MESVRQPQYQLHPIQPERTAMWRASPQDNQQMTDKKPSRQHQSQRPTVPRSKPNTASPGRLVQHQPARRQDWINQSPQEILARHLPGKTEPLRVLEILLELFNTQHTALNKTVSHKTRHERAQFLRRFFRDLKLKAGFNTVPDPRNLGQRHIQAMAAMWQREALAPATIQTYMSFLRGLTTWLGKAGFVHAPAHYGLTPQEYQRHEVANSDKSWSAKGIDATIVIAQICDFDRYVGASMRLMQAFGLRRKESVQVRPFEHVQPFDRTGLPEQQKESENYLWIKGKGGRVRWIPVTSTMQQDALAFAQTVVPSRASPIGNPDRDLRGNLRRLDYALARFGLTRAALGVTAHGLRHQALNDTYEAQTGVPTPVRGGGRVALAADRAARYKVSKLAGHARLRAAGAYIGSRPRQGSTPDQAENLNQQGPGTDTARKPQ